MESFGTPFIISKEGDKVSVKLNINNVDFSKKDGTKVSLNTVVDKSATEAIKEIEKKGNEVLQSIPQDFATQMDSKLDRNQGIENKGKPLVVGADGNVIPGETQGGGDINLDAEMREYMAVVKPKIKQSIINKGGTVLDTDSFKEYSKRIDEIPNNVQAAQTLPPQTKLIGAGAEGGIKLNWQDVGADGYVIVRKIGSAPTTSADGDMIFNGTFPNDGYLDTTAQKSNVYFYRIFPRNKVNQYQSATEGSIVEVSYIDRTGQKQLKDLELGDQIVFGKWDTFDRMKWLIVDKQDVRDGYVTAGCNESFPTKQFDVPENAVDNPNPDGNRKNYGNNRWAFSNANQWLNSDKPKNEWFSPQHQYDVAPSYKNQNGFLNEFTPYEKSIIVQRQNKTFRCSVDGGGYETTIDKMWIPSAYAVNLSMEMVEDGHGLEYFSDNEKRKFSGNSWWLRTINGITSTSHQLRFVSSTGTLYYISANNYCVLRPFCQLSALAYVTWSDSDKAYIFADDSQRIGV